MAHEFTVKNGLSVNYSGDDKSVVIHNSSVSHGITDIVETDVFSFLDKEDNSNGGLRISGLTGNSRGLFLGSYAVNSYTGTLATSQGTTTISSFKKNGTGVTDFADNDNILAIRNNATTLAILKGVGDFYLRAGGLKISNTTTAVAGMTRWTGSDFEGYDGSTWNSFTGSGGSVAGSDTQVQFNDGGSAFGADANFTFDKTKDFLTVGTNNSITIGGTAYYHGVTTSHNYSSPNRGGMAIEVGAGIPIINFARSNTSISSPTIVSDGDYIGYLQFSGYDGVDYRPGVSISAQVDGTPASNVMPTKLLFSTQDAAGVSVTALTLTKDHEAFFASTISTGGEIAPDVDTGGICINHGDNDGYPLTFKNSDVSHPFTSICEADTYLRTNKNSALTGGVNFIGLSTGTTGFLVGGASSNPETSNTGFGNVTLNGYNTDGGTSWTTLTDTQNLVSFRNFNLVKAVVKGSGDIITQAGIKIGAYGQSDTAGAIQWNGSNFQGYTGSAWVDLDSSGSPGGSDGQIQYNNGGLFGGDSALNWDDTNKRIGVGTNSPDYNMEIYSTSAVTSAVTIESNTATAKPGFRMIHYRTGGATATQNGDHLGFFAFSGHNGTNVRDAWNFYSAATGTFSGLTTSSVLRFTRLSDTNLDIVEIHSDGRFITAGGIEINSYLGTPVAGSIQWNGSNFQGHNGATWVDLDSVTAPGGSDSQIQYNNGGVFGGDASFIWDDVNLRLGIGVASPSAKIEVVDTTAAAYIQATTVSNTVTSKSMFRAARQRTSGAPATLANDHLGGMIIAGHDGTSMRDSWHLYSIATANYSSTICKSNIYFSAWHDTGWVTPLQLKSVGTVHFNQGIELNEWTGTPVEGVVDWDGTNFRGYDGASWVNLDVQATGATPGGTVDGQIQYRTGSGTTFGAEEQLRWDVTNNRLGINVPNATALAYGLECWGTARVLVDTAADNLNIYNGSSGSNDTVVRIVGSSGNDTGIELIFDANGKKWAFKHYGNAGNGRLDLVSKFGSFNDVSMTFRPNGDRASRIGINQTNPQEILHVNGAVIVGEHANGTAQTGTIEWDGTNFRGYDGASWINLDNAAGGTPAGADTQIQFNNSGAFGASANLVWNGTQVVVNGDVATGSDDWFYAGDSSTDGSWRWGLNGGSSLVFQKRESGVWNNKHTLS